jgi:menaquinone-dependent protoporphyrinogen IX oxidase
MRLIFNALFLKSPIFLIQVNIDKKNLKKNKKNQIYKKKKLNDEVWRPNNIFLINNSFQHTQRDF